MSQSASEIQPEAVDAGQVEPGKPDWFWQLVRLITRPIATLLFDLKVYNRHFVPERGGVLLISNHQSYLDPVLVAVYLHRSMAYLAKAQLFENKHFAWVIRALHAFPIRQGVGDVSAVREMIKRLKEGHMLNMYPEGTRTTTGELQPIEPGAALVIRRAGVPVVPCIIQGSFEAWPRGRKMCRAYPIRVMYGPPLQIEGLKAAQITRLIDSTFHQMMDELRKKR